MRLAIPDRLTATEASKFCRGLFEHRHNKSLVIDFANLKFVIPQGTMCLFVGITKVIEDRQLASLSKLEIYLPTRSTDAIGYLAYMDFFAHLASPSQIAQPVALPQDRKYIKVSCVHLQRSEYLLSAASFHKKLDEQTQSFAQFLLQTDSADDPATMAVGWCLREAVRNVFEHAGVDRAYVTGQAWRSGKVELSVGDAGIGVYHALEESHHPNDSCHALDLAVKPGITDYIGPETTNDWQNSGFGLYMLSRIAEDFGSLTIVSSGAFLKTEQGLPGRMLRATGSPMGTTLALSLKIPKDLYFTNLLTQYKEEGETEALVIPGARQAASRASTTIWG